MKKALENVKKPNFGSDFCQSTPNLEPRKFFLEFYFRKLLNIVPIYYRMQFKVKLTKEAWENGEKKHVLARFWPVCPKFAL